MSVLAESHGDGLPKWDQRTIIGRRSTRCQCEAFQGIAGVTALHAEVMAIGDELTSGQRLDTNSQWLSQRLGEIGIPVRFHSTVGDHQEALVDALGVEDDEVQADATLQDDLGAESIDFLDIVFRLEKSFDIKIERGELFPEDILTSTEYVEDGKLNEEGIVQLKQRMPFADLTKFEADPMVQNLGKHLTVNDMCSFVSHKMAG